MDFILRSLEMGAQATEFSALCDDFGKQRTILLRETEHIMGKPVAMKSIFSAFNLRLSHPPETK
jgi:hypothetical protein